jgi:hypothetical protein
MDDERADASVAARYGWSRVGEQVQADRDDVLCEN